MAIQLDRRHEVLHNSNSIRGFNPPRSAHDRFESANYRSLDREAVASAAWTTISPKDICLSETQDEILQEV